MWVVRLIGAAAAALALLSSTGCGSSAGGSSVIASYAMGDRAQAGPLIYTVFETRWTPQLKGDSAERVPANRFLMVRLTVVNSGSVESSVPTLTLVDDNGQRFSELANGEGVPQWIGFVRRLKPADTITGNALFDVALKHYKLEVADESEEKKALVDIPLSFGSESVAVPGMPVPQAPTAPPVSPK